MHERNVLAQNENAFFVKDLRKNYLGKSNGGNCLGSNYLEGHYPGIIIRGGNYPGVSCPEAIFLGAIV